MVVMVSFPFFRSSFLRQFRYFLTIQKARHSRVRIFIGPLGF
jgi:hypothetical protein